MHVWTDGYLGNIVQIFDVERILRTIEGREGLSVGYTIAQVWKEFARLAFMYVRTSYY
jgi:hypothetical protein